MADDTSFGDNVVEIVREVLAFLRSPIGAILALGVLATLGVLDVPILEQIVDSIVKLYREVMP